MKYSYSIVSALALLASVSAAQAPATALSATPVAQERTSLAPQSAHVLRHAPHSQEHARVLETRQTPRPMIGVRIAPVDSSVSAQLPENSMPALILTSIFKDSPAERAGLLANDVVTAVDGNSNVTVETLIETISSKKPGSTVTLDISRAGTHRVFNVTVEEIEAHEAQHPRHDVSKGGAWKLKPGTSTWPRFGVAPEGQIMVQRDENGEWAETDSSTDFLNTYHNAILEYHDDHAGYLDLTKPDVDPDGNLRRKIEHLHGLYSEAAGEVHDFSLEHRIRQLETKVDQIHGMLTELLQRTK